MNRFSVVFDIIKDNLIEMLTSAIAVLESAILIKGSLSYEEEIGKYFINDVVWFLVYIIIFLLSIIILVYQIWDTYKEYGEKKKRVFKENDKVGIDKYLTNFIKDGFSIAILSRDLTWVKNDNIEILRNKARKRELLLLLPGKTDIAEELRELGADVNYFGNSIPIKSRMTIVDWNKPHPKLTYPIRRDGLHINYEIQSGEPANQLALELIDLLKSISKEEIISKEGI